MPYLPYIVNYLFFRSFLDPLKPFYYYRYLSAFVSLYIFFFGSAICHSFPGSSIFSGSQSRAELMAALPHLLQR
jgi:hypothetical protein